MDKVCPQIGIPLCGWWLGTGTAGILLLTWNHICSSSWKGGIPVRHRHFVCLKTLHHAMGESFGLWSAFKSHDSTQRFMHEALGLTLNGSHFQLANADACSVSAIQRHHHTVRHPAEIACIWTWSRCRLCVSHLLIALSDNKTQCMTMSMLSACRHAIGCNWIAQSAAAMSRSTTHLKLIWWARNVVS